MYTIFRIYYSFCFSSCNLSEEADGECYLFDTEKEAYRCLKLCFENGEWFIDERYGKVRYYVDKTNPKYIPKIY